MLFNTMPVVNLKTFSIISIIFKSKNKRAASLGVFTYFLLESTVKDENEHSLESIKDGEEIRHHNSLLINKKQPK